MGRYRDTNLLRANFVYRADAHFIKKQAIGNPIAYPKSILFTANRCGSCELIWQRHYHDLNIKYS